MTNQLMLTSMIFVGNFLLQAMEMKRSHNEFMRQQEVKVAAESVIDVARPAVPVAAAGAAVVPQQASIAQAMVPAQQVLPAQYRVDASSAAGAMPLSVDEVSKKEKEVKQQLSFAGKHAVVVIEDKFDLAEIEAFSGSEFSELLQEQYADQTPYIVVRVTTHGQGRSFVHYFDAHQFNRYYFNHRTHTYPLWDCPSNKELKQACDEKHKLYINIINKLPLSSKEIIYLINDLENPLKFTYLCSHADLYSNDQNKRNFWCWTMQANQGQDARLRAQSQCALGDCYHFGRGVQQDYKRAVDLFFAVECSQEVEPAIKANARYRLGEYYYFGRGGVQQDYKKAFDLFSAAERAQEVPPAIKADVQFRLGEYYYSGLGGVQQDYKRAFDLFSAAERAQEVRSAIKVYAQYRLGCCYYLGQGVQQDYKRAFDLFSVVERVQEVSPAIKAEVQYRLGCCYYLGQGVQQDYKRAFDLFSAAERAQGVLPAIKADAQYRLGCCYYLGQGVQQDYKRAFDLFSAAERAQEVQPDVKAYTQYGLGVCYYLGQGVQKDYKQAFAWFALVDLTQVSPAAKGDIQRKQNSR